GNVSVATATRNALVFRALLPGARFDVAAGADRALDGHRAGASQVHGEDGLGGAAKTLDRRLLRFIAATEVKPLDAVKTGQGKVTIIGIGPATNIPRLVARYGKNNVARIVLMSGAFFDPGNITPHAEFNAYSDPLALRRVLALGVKVTFVPLDLCRKIVLTRATVRSYLKTSRSRVVRLLVESHMAYMDHYIAWEGLDGCFPHDAIAVLAAWRPERFHRVPGRVSVETKGARRGKTMLVPDRGSPIDVAMGGDLKWVRDFLATP
ncbi:MAG: nucleoside hydrolase, partial [Stellaceae bacterium]